MDATDKYSIIIPTRGTGDAYLLFIKYGLKLYEKYLNKNDIYEFIITCPKDYYTTVCNDIKIYDMPFKIYTDDDIIDPKYMNSIGWSKQQIIKLNICNFIKTKYYLILDDDIFIMKKLSIKDFFDEHGKIYYSYEGYPDNISNSFANCHIWINSSCEAIGVDIDYIKAQNNIMGVTPQLFSTEIVKKMLEYIGEDWELKIIVNLASEFQLYWNYLIKTNQTYLYKPYNKLYRNDENINIITTSNEYEINTRVKRAFETSETIFMVIQSHFKFSYSVIENSLLPFI